MRRRSISLCLHLAACCASTLPAVVLGDEPLPETVEFNRDIRPILSDTCFRCHGPDSAQRQADLRLDQPEGAVADRDGGPAIVAGHPEQSELYRRITAADPEERMPPAGSRRTLSARQIELLRRWIEQGAEWQTHWSFIRPERPALPPIKNVEWTQNAIDHFVLARLEREGLAPAVAADKTTLIRRVTLDLTGLPATPAEVDAFVADNSPLAYEALVDRLLASPRYGERMAVEWLDAARYADTNGYQTDAERHMWRWRDWVIEAFNRNLPFDQFTVEQIAGDMLPSATLEQIIATGFNRNHRGNGEGGVIAEEFAVEYVVDRVETTYTVWLGLTMGCARCHEHKFDPIEQQEFYQTFAYFNNIPERGKAFKYGNSPPFIKSPTREQQIALAELEAKLASAESHLAALEPQIAAAQSEWEATAAAQQPDWCWSRNLAAHFALDGDAKNTAGKAAEGAAVDGGATFGEGRLNGGAQFDGRGFIAAGDIGDFGFYDKFSIATWVYPGAEGGTILSRIAQDERDKGYAVVIENGKVQVNLVVRWLDDSLRVETETALPPERWSHVTVTYDGSRLAAGVAIYVDGVAQPIRVNLDELNQNFQAKAPLWIGAGIAPHARFHGGLDDVRLYSDCLSAEEVELVAVTEGVSAIAQTPPTSRTAPQQHKLRACFLEAHAPEPFRQTSAELLALRDERDQFVDLLPTTMVMQEMQPPRQSFVLLRGEYDRPGERVAPGLPASLPPLPAGTENNRLGFARWLVDESHPLTARVAVNRYWQMYFGTGLVKTTEDFGSQGEPPSHPELLDWLACEFMSPSGAPLGIDTAAKWDVKALQKLIVMSATYRQSSKASPELLQIDPENRLLARGPRMRLTAEMIRDQALAVSGLLVEKVGGPSVRPYQPAGLWEELSGGTYEQGHGEDLYRRSLYTFWKRTAGPPTMMTFDASARETCIVRESRTNTPLQALTLLNDVTFVEAARKLAERMLTEGGDSPAERIAFAFRLTTAREPSPQEREILRAGFESHLADFRADPTSAEKLLKVGESERSAQLDPRELAASAAVAGLILNLDETVTKE